MRQKNIDPKPLKSGNIPATKAHLELLRQELKSDITSVSLQMDSQFKDLDAKFARIEGRFTTIDSKFTNLDSKFLNIDSKFTNIDSKFEKLNSILFEMKAILEEQSTRNRVVLDGYAHLFDKSTSTDSRIENLEKKIFGVSQK